MDIYLTAFEGLGDFRFPSLPEEIVVTSGTSYQTYRIINIGEVRVPKGTDCDKISWDGWFWGRPRRNMDYLGDWNDPLACVKQLQAWEKNGTPMRLLITDSGINMDVTISSFKPKRSGGHGDIQYSIEFVEYRELKMYTTSEMGITTYEMKTTTRNTSPSTAAKWCTKQTSYNTVSGDTLWQLAREAYGDGSKWMDLYDANAETLNKAAVDHGDADSDWGDKIFPGTRIVVP